VIVERYPFPRRRVADGGKLIEAARANNNATFDFATQLLAAKSPSQVLEVSSIHLRKQFDLLTDQSKELAAIAQKVAIEAAEPIKEGMAKVTKQVA
jgi:hypothetical protein